MNELGILYIVSTPLGNLQDLTFRAVDVLTSVSFIACEDTRRTQILLNHIYENVINEEKDSKPELISYYNEIEIQKTGIILNYLKNGKNVALVSDAGAPLISDPGFVLVREAVKNDIKIEVVPGPSAVISALQLSGLPVNTFTFLGFLPEKSVKKQKYLSEIFLNNSNISTFVFYESPHRLVETLKIISEINPEYRVSCSREITKIHEETKRLTALQAFEYFSQNEPQGEFTVVVSTKP